MHQLFQKKSKRYQNRLKYPHIMYIHGDVNICCLCSLAYEFASVREVTSEHAICKRIEELLECIGKGLKKIISYVNKIMTDPSGKKVDQKLSFNLKNGERNIILALITNVSEYVTFVRMMNNI